MDKFETARLINGLTGNRYDGAAECVQLKIPIVLIGDKIATALKALAQINSMFSYVTSVDGLRDLSDSELNGELNLGHITVTGVRK